MGMRYEAGLTEKLFGELTTMEESSTYQLLISRGRLAEARRIILRQGRVKFGEPTEATRVAVEGIGDLDRLEQLSDRLLQVNSWDELLAP